MQRLDNCFFKSATIEHKARKSKKINKLLDISELADQKQAGCLLYNSYGRCLFSPNL